MRDTFRTSDLWLSAALLASGKKLVDVSWDGPRASFGFLNARDCQEASQAHWVGDLKVSSKAFADALRTLKDRLHGDEKWNRQPLSPGK